MQEGSGPCKSPNLSHLLWSYGMYVPTRDEVNMHVAKSMLLLLPFFFSTIEADMSFF